MDVRKTAHLARLELTDEEAERYGEQVEQILHYIDQLNRIDVSDIEATAHAAPVFDVFREDEATHDGLTAEEALQNAPATALGQFKMPKVID